jgi:hypothetical protein
MAVEEKVIEAWAFLEQHNVKLQPVIDKKGIVHWSAGYVVLANNGWQNIVKEGHRAQGATPLAALVALSRIERRE